jgi:hypothetical protein
MPPQIRDFRLRNSRLNESKWRELLLRKRFGKIDVLDPEIAGLGSLVVAIPREKYF